MSKRNDFAILTGSAFLDIRGCRHAEPDVRLMDARNVRIRTNASFPLQFEVFPLQYAAFVGIKRHFDAVWQLNVCGNFRFRPAAIA